MLPKTKSVWEYCQVPAQSVSAGLFVLLLLCVGLVISLGLIVYCIKRPLCLAERAEALGLGALPGQLVGLILLLMCSGYLLAAAVYTSLFPEMAPGAGMLFVQTLFFQLPVLILIGVLLHVTKHSGRKLFGIYWKQAPRLFGLAVLFYLGVLPILWFCSLLYQFFLTSIGREFYMQDVVQLLAADAEWPVRACLFFIAVVVAPVFEEVMFRGVLFPYLLRRTGLWPAVMLVSAAFAGMHMHVPSLVPLFLLSCAFCLAYVRTRSLLVPIGMHAAFNGVTVILLLLTSG